MDSHHGRLLTLLRAHPTVSVVVLILLLFAGVVAASNLGKKAALERVELILDRSADGHKNLLDLMDNSILIPKVLEKSAIIQDVLARPGVTSLKKANEYLEEVAHGVRADAIFVLDLDGVGLASSNWREPESLVGHRFGFRPYFQQAKAGRTGRYVAMGAVIRKVGLYIARPVTVDGRIAGVIAVKVSVDDLQSRVESLWNRDAEIVLDADENGVVFVSPVAAFLFKTLDPVTDALREAIEAGRQYHEKIAPIAFVVESRLSGSTSIVRFEALPHRTFVQKLYYFPDIGQRLYLHADASQYREIWAVYTAVGALAMLAVFLVSVNLFQRFESAARLVAAAIRDPLTGLHTRLFMVEWVESAIREHNRNPGAGLGLVIFDLDRFKLINDTHGHLAGDAILKQIAAIIRDSIRGADLGVRFGGEELAVFIRCADKAEAVALGERVRRRVEQIEVRSDIGKVAVTLSGGVAFHVVGESLDAFFARADAMLYEAKALGRNRIQ